SVTAAVGSPWVILSSGVAEADFPTAIAVACEEGASGFLAGRAVWASCLGATDVAGCLAGPAVARMQRFADVADRAILMRSGSATQSESQAT
ncbi:MAG: aldolase, partial [Actinomycetota bacterium]